MGQSFTAGSIAAIITVIAIATLIVLYVYTFPVKKNGGLSLERGQLNKAMKDGATTRIMCLGTGRYLRRRPDFTASDCSDLPYPAGHTLVTADASRAQATLWTMKLCRSCPATDMPKIGSIVQTSVDGQWCFYERETDNSAHCLTFTQYDTAGARLFNGTRTILKSFPTGEPYTKGNANAMPVLVPDNYLESSFWFDLAIPEGYIGPNGAFIMQSYPFGTPSPQAEYISGAWSNGIYHNPNYTGTYPLPAAPPDPDWQEQTCYELKGAAEDYDTISLVPNASKAFFIEVL